MPSPSLPAPSPDYRPFLAVCGILVATTVPIACAHGSTETDLPGFGGAGAGGALPTTSSSSTGGFPSSSSSTTASTGGFPSSSSTSGFPSSSSTSGFPSSTSTSGFPSSTSSSGFSSSSSTSSGSSSCDAQGDCQGCAGCADASVCLFQSLDCQYDFYCPDIASCVSNCTSQACFDNCLNSSDPYSAQLFADYYNCLTCSCVVDCQVPAGSCP